MLKQLRQKWGVHKPDADPVAQSVVPDKTRSASPESAEQGAKAEAHHAAKGRSSREFLVVGLGRFGASLTKSLVTHGHDVLAIDADYQRVQALSVELPHVIQINATSIDALREVGADHFDTAIVCIGEDFESNLLATALLRKLGVRRVIAKGRTRTQRDILLQVGADEVILPEHEAGRRLAQRLSATGFIDYLQLGPNIGVVEMLVPEQFHEHTLAEADLNRSYGLLVLAIRREGRFYFNPQSTTVLRAGDELLVFGNMRDAERLSS